MANHVLFRTSVMMAVVHAAAMLTWGTCWYVAPFLSWVYVIGVLLSLLNHGWTSAWYVWVDRLWMVLGCMADWYHMQRVCRGSECGALLALQISLIGSFVVAKIWVTRAAHGSAGNIPHMMMHFGGTMLHVLLLWKLGSFAGTIRFSDLWKL
mmetsp:Transcript_11532/g.20471  ORF Transcript_11532/g.20471 Transcript_11532/m.20471 type:complete len:152 (+) Transcript_11532:146-601(+)